jgi:DNA-binding Xre family transcriptional regulator
MKVSTKSSNKSLNSKIKVSKSTGNAKKTYRVAGLNMKGLEAPTPLLKVLLNEPKDYVEHTQIDTSKGSNPKHITRTLKAELAARSAGELVHKAMDAQKVSLRELASRLGVVNSRVAEIRKSGQAIEVQTLARYAEALGYDLEIAFVSKEGERLVAR